jgi:prepilin-type N-terminal cleavage/methylation domain-containing protein
VRNSDPFSPHHAFTLIELLVVVTIIAILAAIALPNFLEAQTRAKVARARADLRTLATGLESYRVDMNSYPPSRGSQIETEPVHRFNGYGQPCFGGFQTMSLRLSTPVAYLTTASIIDPLKRGGSEGGQSYQSGNPADVGYGFHNVFQFAILEMTPGWYPDDFSHDYGFWRLFSVGPNRTYDGTFGEANMGWFYDPTNGTVSSGMIVRTQRDPDGRRLIIPDP